MKKWLAVLAVVAGQFSVAMPRKVMAETPSLPANAFASASESVTDLSPVEAQRTVLAAVAGLQPTDPLGRRYRQAFAYGSALFPDDGHLRGGAVLPALTQWLALSDESRIYDVLILPGVDYFWQQDGAAYSASFLLHLVPDGHGGTTITIFQTQPKIFHGRSFKVLGRAGPGFYVDIQPAAPSAQAMTEFRAWLTAVLERPAR